MFVADGHTASCGHFRQISSDVGTASEFSEALAPQCFLYLFKNVKAGSGFSSSSPSYHRSIKAFGGHADHREPFHGLGDHFLRYPYGRLKWDKHNDRSITRHVRNDTCTAQKIITVDPPASDGVDQALTRFFGIFRSAVAKKIHTATSRINVSNSKSDIAL